MIVNCVLLLGQHVMWLMDSVSRIVRIMDQLHVGAEVAVEVAVEVDIVEMGYCSHLLEKSVM